MQRGPAPAVGQQQIGITAEERCDDPGRSCGHPSHPPRTYRRISVTLRVRAERMGPGTYESVGNSQSFLTMTTPMIFTRTRATGAM
jgi:hypothetical protein